MDVSKIIKKLRKSQRLTLEEVANGIGSTKSYIWELEDGRTNPGLNTLINLADFFDVTIDELVGRVKPKPSKKTIAMRLRSLASELERKQ